jgi:hypothetical protein
MARPHRDAEICKSAFCNRVQPFVIVCNILAPGLGRQGERPEEFASNIVRLDSSEILLKLFNASRVGQIVEGHQIGSEVPSMHHRSYERGHVVDHPVHVSLRRWFELLASTVKQSAPAHYEPWRVPLWTVWWGEKLFPICAFGLIQSERRGTAE